MLRFMNVESTLATFTLSAPCGPAVQMSGGHQESMKMRSLNLGTGDAIVQPPCTADNAR